MPNPFAHIELTTGDLPAAQAFYKKVFAWKLREMPGMNYTMIEVGTGLGGGMTAKGQPEAPTAWMPYVEVSDVKKTMATAKKAGAKIVLDHMSIGEMGAIGIFIDPTGATLGVWEPGKPAPKAAKKVTKKATKKKASKKVAKKAAKKAAKKKR